MIKILMRKRAQKKPFRARTGSALRGRELLRPSKGLLLMNLRFGKKLLGHLWHISSHQSATSKKDRQNTENQPKSTPNPPKSTPNPAKIDPKSTPERPKIDPKSRPEAISDFDRFGTDFSPKSGPIWEPSGHPFWIQNRSKIDQNLVLFFDPFLEAFGLDFGRQNGSQNELKMTQNVFRSASWLKNVIFQKHL